MPTDDSKKELLRTYGEDLKKYDAEMKRIKEQNDLLAANVAQEEARNAKKQAAHEEKVDKRYSKSQKAQDKLSKHLENMKDSGLKGYESFATSMMDIAGLAQDFSKSLNADVWAYLAGPFKDGFVDSLPSAASDFAKQAKEQTIPLDYFDIPPLELVKVTDDGKLNFTSFEDNPRLADKNIPQDLLHKADIANRAAVNFLIRDAGYECDTSDGVYKKEGRNLNPEDLENILSSANFKEQVDKAIKNVHTYEEELNPPFRPSM